MKKILLTLFYLFALTLNECIGQENMDSCKTIIVNDSTLDSQESSPFGFGLLNDYIWKSVPLEYVNEYDDVSRIICVENNCLKFTINYGCGCGEIHFNLLTDGLIKQDEHGNSYADLKFVLKDEDWCERLCWNHLSYDLSLLTDKVEQLDYLKLHQIEKPIKMK